MSNHRVFVTRRISENALELLRSQVNLEIWEESQPPSLEILLEKTTKIDGLLCLLTDPINQTLIQQATHLKVISQMAVGYDNIDVQAATKKRIPVGHTPGVLTEATADLTWALLMAISRRIIEAEKFVKNGQWKTWEPLLLLGADVTGSTLGIIGLGRIGQAVARRAKGFNMRILYYNPQQKDPKLERDLGVEYVDLNTLLRTSDFVTIHTSLNSETYHLLDQPQFAQMKPTALLINTARGDIINQTALYQALKTQKIAGAALDVTTPEPLPPDHDLLTLPNCLILPHIGSATYKTRSLMAEIAVQNLLAGLVGKPLLHCVNPEVYHPT